jgi:hypothetical protein
VRALAALATFLAACSLSAQALTTIPAQPRAGEEFLIVFETDAPFSPVYAVDAPVDVVDGNMTVRQRLAHQLIPGDSKIVAGASVAGANPGTYAVNVVTTYCPPNGGFCIGFGRSSTPAGTVSVGPTLAATTPQFAGLDGLWYREDQPGWGLTLAQGASGKLFVVWYTYEGGASGSNAPTTAAWFTMTGGRWISPTEYRGILYASHGTSASQERFLSIGQFLTPVGVATLKFASAGSVQFSVEGVQPSPYATPVTLVKYRF